ADLFENLIIAQAPVGVAYVNFAEDILKRLGVVALAVLICVRGGFLRQALRKQTAQTKSTFDARSRSALRTGDWFLLEPPCKGNVGGTHRKASTLGEDCK